jgi:hypothetical protein
MSIPGSGVPFGDISIKGGPSPFFPHQTDLMLKPIIISGNAKEK